MELTRYFGNPDLHASAKWLTIGEGKETFKLKIAPHDNPEYKQAVMDFATVGAEIDQSSFPKMVEMDRELTSKYILLDWEDILIDGVKLEYNKDNAMKLLKNFPDIDRMVKEFAFNLEEERKKKVEALKKK